MTRLAGIVALLLAAPSWALADAARGEVVFQRCYACHSVKAGEHGLPGPNLGGVLGRRAGTLAGFEFSPAMIEAGGKRKLVWTRKTLGAFLADPERVVPGTTMSMPGLASAADRADVIDYLEGVARALRLQSSHGRGIVPAMDACAFFASSVSR